MLPGVAQRRLPSPSQAGRQLSEVSSLLSPSQTGRIEPAAWRTAQPAFEPLGCLFLLPRRPPPLACGGVSLLHSLVRAYS